MNHEVARDYCIYKIVMCSVTFYRLNGVTMEHGTTLLAVKTHQVKCKAGGEDAEYGYPGYPITCGNSRAVLLFKKFVCIDCLPDINCLVCLQFNEQLISPKQFVNLAEKATLKDWKRAIRLGGVVLRKMMDSGQIDFFQHDSVCSNTCRSTKFDARISSTLPPPGTLVQPDLSCLAPVPAGGRELPLTEMHNVREGRVSFEDSFRATAERTNGPQQLANPKTADGCSVKTKTADMPEGVLSLWRRVSDSGLMKAVLSSLQHKLVTTFRGVELCSEKANLQESDVFLLHSLCEVFGLLDSVRQAVDLRWSQSGVSNIYNRVHVLDEILKDHRNLNCNKNRSYKTTPLKRLRPHHHQRKRQNQNLLLTDKRSLVIRPLPINGLPAATHSKVTHPTAQSHLVGGDKAKGE
ncbi:glucocorticoid modulatory element-binding protein 1-like [Nematolebias whitei]|uniref:glucocorticoid modulatory element-binding protein 1-like n=1 Tax=Nematolebias whitei TaxID=451745 RepID=UPI00189B4254|nr:glucocorticoid modulatory element-binding protein 1-like [Nematolebias whitei]